jgi:hypothetical protein
MRRIIPFALVSGLFSGCTSQPPPPPKPDLLTTLFQGVVALQQVASASKQSAAIRADTAVLFPSRSQAIALGLLLYRFERNHWPATIADLQNAFTSSFPQAVPPDAEFEDLRFFASNEDKITFGFVRPGLGDERYELSANGTISFSLEPKPSSLPAVATAPAPDRGFPWSDLVAQIFIQLPLRMLTAGK